MGKRERGTGGLFKIKGSNNYYAQIYRDGRPCRITTKTDVKQEAQAFLRNLLTDADAGKAFVGDMQKITYGDLRAALIQNYTERGNKSLLVHADGTEFINGLAPLDEFYGYKSEEEPGVSLTKINTDSAREFATKRLAEGVTNSTVNNSLKLIRRMLHIAHEDGKIQVIAKIRFYKANGARKGFLPQDKFAELIGHLPLHLRPLITFLYWCGVRLGEAQQIDWKQVDLDQALVRLEDEQTKSGEARTVPLPDVLVAMLKQVDPKTGPVFDSTNLRKAWCKACDAVGLGKLEPIDKQNNRRYTGLIVHDLRRSAIRNLMKAGTSENVAMRISGHKTRAVFDRYHIVDTVDVVAAMRRVQDAAKGLTSSAREVSVSSVRKVPTASRRKWLSA
jgi:integrase